MACDTLPAQVPLCYFHKFIMTINIMLNILQLWRTQPMQVQVINHELEAACTSLETQSPEAILRWAVDRFHPRLTMATAFGAEGCCLIHMLAEIEPKVHVFNLDTGYQFPETLALR